jgi:hypothetical protein
LLTIPEAECAQQLKTRRNRNLFEHQTSPKRRPAKRWQQRRKAKRQQTRTAGERVIVDRRLEFRPNSSEENAPQCAKQYRPRAVASSGIVSLDADPK